jgi:GT2 family glycosyltransferase
MTKRKRYHSSPASPVSKTLVDVVIPVHRRIDLLEKCLKSIPDAMGGISYRVIIVDNNTPQEEKRELYPSLIEDNQITVIQLGQNSGFPSACNLGVRKGKSPLIFLLNSDVILDPGSLMELVLTMDDPSIGVAGMKLVFPEDVGERLNPQIRPARKIQHVGLASNIRGEFIHAYVGWSEDHPKPNNVRDMYAVTGAALMTRRVIWKRANGLFEEYKQGGYEDVDYCLTVRDMGFNVVVNPKASGVHYTGATAEYYQMPHPLMMNRMLFMSRWGEKLNYTELYSW